METVLITGGTGLIGKELTRLLTEVGYKVIIMSRQRPSGGDGQIRYAQWNVKEQTLDVAALQEADYIVHLAGANVAGQRWTSSRKLEILTSRTRSSGLIADMLAKHPNKVKKVISASAIGFYGDTINASRPFVETDTPADDFLGTTCVAWENSIKPVAALGKKLVIFRTGIALSREGGALFEFYRPLRLGVAAILGSGEQWVSWIHIHDMVRLYLNAIVNDNLEGIFNAVAPHPVTNEQLVLSMATAARNKSFVPVHTPAFALKLILGEMSVEVLKSVKVSSAKMEGTGFQFSYPNIDDAMAQLFKKV